MGYGNRSRWVRMEVWMEVIDPSRLRAQMQMVGLGNRALARACKVNHSFINRLVNGTAKSCTRDLAEKIAQELRVHVDLLFVTKTSSLTPQTDVSRKPKRVAA
jgi:plasmid maintenance system antidote protein VapI